MTKEVRLRWSKVLQENIMFLISSLMAQKNKE